MFGLPEHWQRDDNGVVTLRHEVEAVTETQITVASGRIWLNQGLVAGQVDSIRRIAGLLHEADAIATLQRISA